MRSLWFHTEPAGHPVSLQYYRSAVDLLRIHLGSLAENRIPAALKRSMEASPKVEGALDLKAMRCRLLIALREEDKRSTDVPALDGVRLDLCPWPIGVSSS